MVMRGLLFSLPKSTDRHPVFEATHNMKWMTSSPVQALHVSNRTEFHRALVLLEQGVLVLHSF
jgi:hypothetical protein